MLCNKELNASDSLSLAEIKPCFDSGAADEQEKPLPKVMQQRQAILAGSAGVVLLVSGVALYIMKMPIVAVVVRIVGLACVGFALYNSFKPNTKLEKVEDIEQSIIAHSPLSTI